jgi:glycosyltransferase involved in cell wall biosynthesis
MKEIQISVISPMHNEELSVDEFLKRTNETLINYGKDFEIIIVNDGSCDNTLEKLKQALSKYENLKIIDLARNSGQWAAIYAGIQNSSGEYLIIMDSDLQNLPEDIPKLHTKALEGYDLVSGVRKGRTESLFFKKLPSKIANWMLRKVTGCPSKDMGGYKCIRGDMARNFHLKAGYHRLLPALAWNFGGNVADVDVQFPARKHGKSHYGFSRVFDVFFDIILFAFQRSFKSRPLYLFGRLSFFIFLISISLFVWVFIAKIFFQIDMGTRPPFFISLIGFLSSFIFLSMGFILEMLNDIQNTVHHYYPYLVKHIYQKEKTYQEDVFFLE